jgi:hypothetical protein
MAAPGERPMSEKSLHSVRKGMQVSVFLDDEPGTLSRVTSLLGRHRINIYALTLSEGVGHGYVRMVVDKHAEAVSVLRAAEELVLEREVLLLELSNAPGCLGRVTEQLAAAKINLEYAYCAAGPSVEMGLVVVRVNDTDKALKVLQDLT